MPNKGLWTLMVEPMVINDITTWLPLLTDWAFKAKADWTLVGVTALNVSGNRLRSFLTWSSGQSSCSPAFMVTIPWVCVMSVKGFWASNINFTDLHIVQDGVLVTKRVTKAFTPWSLNAFDVLLGFLPIFPNVFLKAFIIWSMNAFVNAFDG